MATIRSLPPSISPEALMGKSKAFIARGLFAKAADSFSDYQLWASLSLELLAKASLAAIHPSLIVDPQKNQNALLISAGIEANVHVATISADTAYTRLKHTAAPRFNNTVYDSCKLMADLRNAHLHSGELPFEGRMISAWEDSFWHACEIILESMSLDLDAWLGASEARAPKALLAAAAEAKHGAAKKKIAEARLNFEEKFPNIKKRNALITASKTATMYQHLSSLKGSYDDFWLNPCPSCSATAIVAGDKTYEELSDYQDDAEDGDETVKLGFAAEEFFCPTCELNLKGEVALSAADIDLEYTTYISREIEYEPDYGND